MENINFCVEISSISVDNPDFFVGTPAIGSKFYGDISYDKTNIPGTGKYIIGYRDAGYTNNDPSVNAYQAWTLNWSCTISSWPWMFDPFCYPNVPELLFSNGRLSGIKYVYDWGIGNRFERFIGKNYNVEGLFWDKNGGQKHISITGVVSFL